MFRKALLSSALFILLVVSLLGAAELAVRNQRVGVAAPEDEDLPTDVEWVRVKVDVRLFTMFAALNAAGYDREGFGEGYHPVRQRVRERLTGRTYSGQQRLRQELKFVDSYNFVVWALHYGGPPEFIRQEGRWAGEGMPAFLFFGLDQVLRDFYREMDIAALWQEVRPQYELEAARYQREAGPALQAALDYTRLKKAPFRQVIVIPNLLTSHWNGNGPQVGDTAYVVVGPTGYQPGLGLIQHEVLHSLVGPLVETTLDSIDPQQAKRLNRALQKRIQGSYGTWESLVEESIIRALDARLAGPEWREISLRNDEQAGFSLVRPLAEKLQVYEAGGETLAEFMPELLGMLNEIDLRTIE